MDKLPSIDVVILAAGLGTRLYPLTKNKPKALVEIGGKPLLAHLLMKLKKYCVNKIVINVYHFATQIKKYLENEKFFGFDIQISDESNELLDTGGGLKKALSYLEGNNPILVHNVDIISNFDINKLHSYLLSNNTLAVLLIQKGKSKKYFIFNEDNDLAGWGNTRTKERIITRSGNKFLPFSFRAIHLLNPTIKNLIKEDGVFSIVDMYLNLSKKYEIKGYLDSASVWFDVGNIAQLKQAELHLGNSA